MSHWTTKEVPMDWSPPGSSVHGIPQARILKWVAFPSPGDLPHPETETVTLTSPALAGGFFTTSAAWEARESLRDLFKKWARLAKIITPDNIWCWETGNIIDRCGSLSIAFKMISVLTFSGDWFYMSGQLGQGVPRYLVKYSGCAYEGVFGWD